MVKIAPSMLSADFAHLASEIQEIESYGVEYLHIDIMDGTFVPNISFGPMVFKAIRAQSQLIFDCHMMVQNPERYIDDVVKAGADIITVHAEATQHLHRVLQQIKAAGVKAGVVLNPGTPLTAVEPVLDMVDMVLIMTVNPGFGGQAFIESMLTKISQLKQMRDQAGLDFEIEVDGGVNDKSGRQCIEAGADVLVAGSYIFNAEDRQAAVESLR
ncbi:ribulose-phosphate 3-epimerase [Vaginisenegalia massiliensis]|uniref:ribulose-phosphate 3-epimerase n=1 Tax=Vaginisenegalia massiliensis TaxID=2058294 RepID=UPI000F5203EB|nr:ribulose-phosphate 3-epimerase [Vaginisenegalia massiliensis]